MSATLHTHPAVETEQDLNLVEIWLRKDPVRWVAGAMAGIFAAIMALAMGMILAAAFGMEALFPIKYMALPILGGGATELGMNLGSIAVGLIVACALGAVWGFVFAHFTGTNNPSALLGMGLVWGLFTWIFVANLFMPSFRAITAAKVPPSATFPVCLVFGLSMASVAFFDRAFRGRKS